ncbi:MAG TPA: undecaprenyl-phosphate galactose phosphotransferase WbaP [Acetobacteraceae bacterium]|nr:undecaprenyl-phosphate galactose phosphotransferase WbaP [Acetobacteraceae bacterium]
MHDAFVPRGDALPAIRGTAVRWRPLVLLGADLSAFAIAAVAAFSLGLAVEQEPFDRTYQRMVALGTAWHGWATFLVLTCLLTYFAAQRHYTARIPFWIEARAVLCGTAFAFVADGLISVAAYGATFGNEGMFRWLLFALTSLSMRRMARGLLGARGYWSLRTLVVGEASVTAGVTAALRSEPALGYDIVGTLSPRDAPHVDDVGGWLRLLVTREVQFVVVQLGGRAGSDLRGIAAVLARARVPLAVVPSVDGLPVQGFSQHYFLSHDVLMLACRDNLDRPVARMAKLVLDQVGAALALFFLAPLFLVLASLVRRDGGPALFRHKRIGAGGQTFECIKFRTMIVNADSALRDLLAHDPDARREWEQQQKLRNDPRVTPVGLFLRRTSLDELPQLLNVLRGEMSLVGPRPIVEAEISRYGGDIEYYYGTKPGITGLWQVSGRSDTSYARRVQLDRWYARNWSLWHDIAILFKTIPVVFRREGAV